MQLEVKDPVNGVLLRLEAKPEKWHGEPGFRIRHPNGYNFWLSARSGAWQSEDGRTIDPELILRIGKALDEHPLKKQLINDE